MSEDGVLVDGSSGEGQGEHALLVLELGLLVEDAGEAPRGHAREETEVDLLGVWSPPPGCLVDGVLMIWG
jgi:hypothetical protein